MGRPMSYQPEGEWTAFEITITCHQRRFLMRPGDECTKRIIGVLAKAQQLFGERVRVTGGGGTSNHLHLLVETLDSVSRAYFKSHIKTNISKELGELHKWPGAMYAKRTRDIAILDEGAYRDRLAYVLRHGQKEALLRSTERWPGVPWVGAMTGAEPMVGVWYDRTKLHQLMQTWKKKPKDNLDPAPTLQDVAEELTLELTPPSFMAEMTEEERQACWQDIMKLGEERYPAPAKKPLGKEKLLNQNPHGKPKKSKNGPAPSVHATCAQAAKKWKRAYRDFVTAYRDAWERLKNALKRGVKRPSIEFPTGGVPPTSPMPLLL